MAEAEETKILREYFKQKYIKRCQNPEYLETMRKRSAERYMKIKEQREKERQENGVIVKRGRPRKYMV